MKSLYHKPGISNIFRILSISLIITFVLLFNSCSSLDNSISSYNKNNKKVHLTSEKAKYFEDKILKYSKILSNNRNDVKSYVELAMTYGEMGDIRQAINVIKEGIRYNPDNTMLYSYLALIYKEIGEYDMAIETFRLVQNIDPAQSEDVKYEIIQIKKLQKIR